MQRDQRLTGRPMFRKHLSYANVIASIALFIALGGSAVAAATLTRDSVGAPQIRKDAVRSPEIQKDAVRSSEIRDEDIKVGDIATGAETSLRSEVEVAEDNDDVFFPRCNGIDLAACPNLLAMRLNTDTATASRTGQRPSPGGPQVPEPGRNWLIQAKLTIDDTNPGPSDTSNRCGLVLDNSSGQDTVLDEARHHLAANDDPADSEAIALTAVFSDNRFVNPRIALRCTMQTDEELVAEDQKITALEVGKVIGP
jgi:hypothetical protein